MIRETTLAIAIMPVSGYVVTVDGEQLAAFSDAAELCRWLEAELSRTEPERSADDAPPRIARPEPPKPGWRVFSRD